MSLNIFHKTGSGTGVLQKIAGHTILLDANVSEMREGTFTVPAVPANNALIVDVTFTDPMPDTDYAVVLSDVANTSTAMFGEVHSKQTTGFKVTVGRPYSSASTSGTARYIAFKPIKLDGYTELQNKVNNPDSVPTEDSLNLVTSGGVYNAIKDRGISEHYYLGTGVYDRPYLPRTITINKTGHNVLIVTPHMGSTPGSGSTPGYQSNYSSIVFDISSQLYEANTNLNGTFCGYNEITHEVTWELIHFADVTAVTQDTLTLSTEGVTTLYPWFHIHVI